MIPRSTLTNRVNNLADGVEDLKSNDQRLESDFSAFFPDLMNYAKTYQFQFLKTII
ncbi:MAG: ACP phosphodiesterase [Microcoleus anatoxicus]